MTIFAIITEPNPNNVRLPDAISGLFGTAHFKIDGGQAWLVSSGKTAKDVSDELGITDGTNGAAVVVEVAGYFGRANPNIWSWIKANWDTPATVKHG
jgi:hypothetical protein